MHFYLKKPNQKEVTLILLKYYISKSEGKFVYSTKQQISPEDWDFSAKDIKHKRGRTDLMIIRNKIQPYIDLLTSLLAYYSFNDIKITKNQLKKDFDIKFKGGIEIKTNPEFLESIDELILVKKSSNQLAKNTEKRYKNFKSNLQKYEEYYMTKLSYMSFEKKNNFVENWMAFCYNELKHRDNTVGRSLGFIKTILLYTRRKGYHSLNDLSHIKRFSQETDDIALTKEELLFYYNFDFGTKNYLGRARDVFCIGCFTGQRFSDYSVFNKFDYKNGNIEKRAKKTKNKSIIPVDANPKLKSILDKYDWDLPKISEQKFRDYVKMGLHLTGKLDYEIKKVSYRGTELIEEVYKKWQMVGSHTARRTFITLALEDGWNYKEIMTVAGIKKVETVIKYDKVNSERLNKKVSMTFGN